ncbi:MAG TPA: YciI family protein [Vicinamibacterales bacterium]|jgi:hypothetical protein|nr:YciI family protein [Vicinamibacterales bacterium]
MPEYMLLLYDDPAEWRRLSPEEIQKAIEKYVAWGRRLREAGLLVGSEKLRDEPGKVIRIRGGRMHVTDGPYAETKEVLGGYYTIVADSYAEAIERCRDHPHFEYGGTIEVREIEKL